MIGTGEVLVRHSRNGTTVLRSSRDEWTASWSVFRADSSTRPNRQGSRSVATIARWSVPGTRRVPKDSALIPPV